MKISKYLMCLLSLYTTIIFAQPKEFYAQVIAIKDGDTVKILYEKQEYTVRLSHIDCPEKKQDYGKKAKQRTADLCFGKKVRIKHNGKKDRNGRILGEIFASKDLNVNKKMVEEGLAWHYTKFSKDKTYAILEQQARSKKIGIWSLKNPIAPWDWRKGMRY